MCGRCEEGNLSGMMRELPAAVLEKVIQGNSNNNRGKRKLHSLATGGINRLTQELELHSVPRNLSFLWPHRLVLLIESWEITSCCP